MSAEVNYNAGQIKNFNNDIESLKNSMAIFKQQDVVVTDAGRTIEQRVQSIAKRIARVEKEGIKSETDAQYSMLIKIAKKEINPAEVTDYTEIVKGKNGKAFLIGYTTEENGKITVFAKVGTLKALQALQKQPASQISIQFGIKAGTYAKEIIELLPHYYKGAVDTTKNIADLSIFTNDQDAKILAAITDFEKGAKPKGPIANVTETADTNKAIEGIYCENINDMSSFQESVVAWKTADQPQGMDMNAIVQQGQDIQAMLQAYASVN